MLVNIVDAPRPVNLYFDEIPDETYVPFEGRRNVDGKHKREWKTNLSNWQFVVSIHRIPNTRFLIEVDKFRPIRNRLRLTSVAWMSFPSTFNIFRKNQQRYLHCPMRFCLSYDRDDNTARLDCLLRSNVNISGDYTARKVNSSRRIKLNPKVLHH